MTVSKINYNQKYIQDEHQRQQQQIVDAVNILQTQVLALQVAVKALKAKAGIK